MIAVCDTSACSLKPKVHAGVALLVILAPSLDGGSLAPTEYRRRPFAVRPMIAVWVRKTALSAAGCTQTAIMEHTWASIARSGPDRNRFRRPSVMPGYAM